MAINSGIRGKGRPVVLEIGDVMEVATVVVTLTVVELGSAAKVWVVEATPVAVQPAKPTIAASTTDRRGSGMEYDPTVPLRGQYGAKAMSGVWWAVTAGILFGLSQAVNRRANQTAGAIQVTFALLLTGTVALGGTALVSQDLGALERVSATALLWAAAAGIIHFFFGWTFLVMSQQRIGASQTGVVIAATPLVGSLLAAAIIDEALPPVTVAGVLLVTAGVALLSARREADSRQRSGVPWFALATAASWGLSPLFIRRAVAGLPVPLLAVTAGMASATAAYAAMLAVGRRVRRVALLPAPAALGWTAIAGVLVAAAIAAQWTAYGLAPIAIAISLMQLSTPVVVFVAPLVAGGELERITPALVVGLLLVVGGSSLVVLSG